MSSSYVVTVAKFTERHYIKDFSKKYKGAWDVTLSAIEKEFQNFEVLFQRDIAETIVDVQGIKICKTEFRVAGTKQSRHGSGNRCIVAVLADTPDVIILLVYHKNHLNGKGNETAKWKNVIKKNYPEYKNIL